MKNITKPIAVAGILFLGFFVLGCANKATGEPEKPNIIYIMLDEVGYF